MIQDIIAKINIEEKKSVTIEIWNTDGMIHYKNTKGENKLFYITDIINYLENNNIKML